MRVSVMCALTHRLIDGAISTALWNANEQKHQNNISFDDIIADRVSCVYAGLR